MWKATEFRHFLLYTGPVVLIGKLNSSWYKNSVCVRVRIVLSTDRFSLDHDYIARLFEVFVKIYSNIYEKQIVSYNVHSLLHIIDDVRTFGSLDSVS